MKKYLLLFLMCVYASIGAWAEAVTVSTDSNGLTTVSINMDDAEAAGKTLADLIAIAKTHLGSTDIYTLKVTGQLSTTDLESLDDANKATRIDLSETTLATGAAITSLQVPSTLESLILPPNQTVKGTTLETTLSAVSSLQYAYSPSSDSQKPGPNEETLFDSSKNLVADYVWVNRQNALPTAFTNEVQLRNSYHIKVASSVALTDTDVDFDGLGEINKPSNYLFLNFSDANLTPAVAATYKVTDYIGYRIILPNDWTGDQMAVFAANPNCGNLSSVYSYNGTKLNIMEIKDWPYSPASLADPRIVRAGTTEVSVISGTYNGETYAQFGTSLLAALNNMGKSEFDYNNSHYTNTVGLTVTKVSISTGSNVPNAITFDNPTIQTLELKNVGQGWSSLNVDACSSLQTLNLNHINLGNVYAKVPAASPKTGLTSINLSGATINGSADFSTSPLTSAFTMDDDTYITSDLLLKSTGLTSFIPKGTIGGDIYLNASNNLTSLDVSKFTQAANRKIHIDLDATNENGTAVISGLDNGTNKTITVPTGYNSSERFHPYNAISDNIYEAPYVPPVYSKSESTLRLHEKETNDQYIYWYDDQVNKGQNITLGTDESQTLKSILDDQDNASAINFTNTTYRRAKIDGPIISTDVDDLASINCQVLDLSSATFDATAWAALKTAFKTSGTNIHSNVRFVILPDTCTREEIINGTALAGLTNVLSVIALNKITGATDPSDNGTNLTSWNKVSGALQAAVVAAGNHSCYAWSKTPDGNTSRRIYTSDISDFRECKISGLINSYDLSKANQNLDANGHLSWDKEPVEIYSGTDPRQLNGSCTAYGPFCSSYNLSVIDLKGAFFEEKGDNTHLAEKDKRYYFQDMTLSKLGIISTGTYKVVVPTDPRAKEIPADFMNCPTRIRAICIPSNIVAIRTRAFYTIDYVWTTATNLAETLDPEGDNTRLDNGAKLKIADGSDFIETSALLYENGAYKENPAFTKKCYVADYSTINGGGTYTFGSNLRLIETGAFANTQPNVKDVYVLNAKAPECHVDAFNTVMYTGNGGYNSAAVSEEGIITREAYFNGRWITMLHYPRQTTTPNVQRYTDPTREYSIATGERDGKGAIIYYPNQSEFIRAYQQGTYGYVWNAWNPTRQYGSVNNGTLTNTTSGWTAENQTKANALFDAYATGTNHQYTSFYKVSDLTGGTVTAPTAEILPYYEVNWNEISYSTATTGNLYPRSEIDANSDADNSGEKTTKDYRGWHQFVLNAYAANTTLESEPYRSYITDNEWWTICPTFDITYEQAILLFGTPATGGVVEEKPYVSKLQYVRRDYDNNVIALNFSKNLMEYPEDRERRKVTTTTDESGKVTDVINASQHGRADANGVVIISDAKDTSTEHMTDVVMSAGVPYMIKPHMPNGNKRMFQVFKNQEEYNKLEEQYEEAGRSMDDLPFKAIINETLYNTMHFALSKTGGQQMDMVESGLYSVPVFVKGTTTEETDKGEYTIDGVKYQKSTDHKYTFVGSFYKSYLPGRSYFLGWDKKASKAKFFYNNKPDAHEMCWCNETGIICPTAPNYNFTITRANNVEPAQWKLGTPLGTQTTENGITTYWLPGDDLATIGGSGAKKYEQYFDSPDVISVVTGINEIDAEEDTKAYGNADVYSVNGQKVGKSLEGLPKGIYIVNGKKFIVK